MPRVDVPYYAISAGYTSASTSVVRIADWATGSATTTYWTVANTCAGGAMSQMAYRQGLSDGLAARYRDELWVEYQAQAAVSAHAQCLGAGPPVALEPPRVIADEADKRAEALLLANLTPEQAAQYRRDRRFDVAVGLRLYRISWGWAGNVHLINSSGDLMAKFCIHPTEAVPFADNMLAQKLMLEADEAQFWRVANRTVLRAAA